MKSTKRLSCEICGKIIKYNTEKELALRRRRHEELSESHHFYKTLKARTNLES